MKFSLKNKGRITQGFLDNATSLYKDGGLAGHTGIDHTKGYSKPVICDNPSYVYKIVYSEDNKSNWQAVYTIVEDRMEICFGHLSRIDVREGDWLVAGQQIGLEGNRGDVFHDGVRITPAMQRAGDTRGSHVHESWRPLVKTYGVSPIRGVHYINGSDRKPFVKDNCLYEVAYDNPQTMGTIDPMQYSDGSTEGVLEGVKRSILALQFALLESLKRKRKL